MNRTLISRIRFVTSLYLVVGLLMLTGGGTSSLRRPIIIPF